MLSFKEWLEMTSAGTSTASIAPVPMRVLGDNGRPYIGIPGRPSPYDKKGRPTVVGRQFPNEDDDNSKHVEEFPYKWLKGQYQSKDEILWGKKK